MINQLLTRICHVAVGNDTAAQADLTLVQHGRLTRRNGPLRFLKHQRAFGVVCPDQMAWCVKLAIAGFGGQRAWRWRVACNPTAIVCSEFRRLQPWMIVALHGPQGVGCHVFAGNKPGFVRASATLAVGLNRFSLNAFGF